MLLKEVINTMSEDQKAFFFRKASQPVILTLQKSLGEMILQTEAFFERIQRPHYISALKLKFLWKINLKDSEGLSLLERALLAALHEFGDKYSDFAKECELLKREIKGRYKFGSNSPRGCDAVYLINKLQESVQKWFNKWFDEEFESVQTWSKEEYERKIMWLHLIIDNYEDGKRWWGKKFKGHADKHQSENNIPKWLFYKFKNYASDHLKEFFFRKYKYGKVTVKEDIKVTLKEDIEDYEDNIIWNWKPLPPAIAGLRDFFLSQFREKDREIIKLINAGYTQEKIAVQHDVNQSTISRKVQKLAQKLRELEEYRNLVEEFFQLRIHILR